VILDGTRALSQEVLTWAMIVWIITDPTVESIAMDVAWAITPVV